MRRVEQETIISLFVCFFTWPHYSFSLQASLSFQHSSPFLALRELKLDPGLRTVFENPVFTALSLSSPGAFLCCREARWEGERAFYFSIIAIFIGIPSGSLYGGESCPVADGFVSAGSFVLQAVGFAS